MVLWPALINAVLGLWLIASPTVIGYGGAAAANDLVMGITVVCSALIPAFLLPRFTQSSWVNLFCGIWITLAPAIIGYQQLQVPASNDVAVGLLITVVASIRVLMPDPEIA